MTWLIKGQLARGDEALKKWLHKIKGFVFQKILESYKKEWQHHQEVAAEIDACEKWHGTNLR